MVPLGLFHICERVVRSTRQGHTLRAIAALLADLNPCPRRRPPRTFFSLNSLTRASSGVMVAH